MINDRLVLIAALLVGGFLVGCASESDGTEETAAASIDTISPETRADSVAYRLLQAHGAEALASAPYLRFNFGIDTPDGERVVARHFWDRTTGDYRVEWEGGADSSYVALINVREVEDQRAAGTVYLNGTELSGTEGQDARADAYGRFINDTYWLLAPLKTFDPGVQRTYVADSSTAEHDVIRLSFGDVGLTPGDQYWLYVSTETGRLDRWAFHLQGMDEDEPPSPFDWTDEVSLDAPDGTVHLATRKQAEGANQAILTDQLSLPDEPPEGVFSSPEPILEDEE